MENIKGTLIELITRNFVEISKKKRANKKNSKRAKSSNRLVHSSNSISSIIINPEIRKIKNKSEKKPKAENLEETAEEESEDKPEIAVNGGYGTVSKHYGMSPVIKYVDYNKIWGHIGAFRSQGMYEDLGSQNGIAMKNGESSREMVSERTLDVGAWNFKYVANMNLNSTVQDMFTITSLVVPFGANVDSKEWEKYTLMMKMSIYQPLIALKFKFA